ALVSGTLTVQAVNGVAQFFGLAINQPGTCAFSISASSVAPGSTNPITVHPQASKLAVIVAPPQAFTANAPFDLTVAAQDGTGNVDTTFNGNVTLSLPVNPGGATLGGPVTVRAVNGIAVFHGVTVDKPAGGYSIRASAGGLTATTINAIDVSAAGVATHLAF